MVLLGNGRATSTTLTNMKNVTGIIGFQVKTETKGSILPNKAIVNLSDDVSVQVKVFEILLITDFSIWPS